MYIEESAFKILKSKFEIGFHKLQLSKSAFIQKLLWVFSTKQAFHKPTSALPIVAPAFSFEELYDHV